jgi:L-fucose mutarotase/ribose pyranase (RbsD/FucU family)
MWDPYVMAMLRAMKGTGDAFVAVSANPPAGYTAQTLLGYGTSLQSETDALLKLWNLYAGLDPASILLQAGDILKTYQDVVQRVSKVRIDGMFKQFATVKKLPDPPSIDVQNQVVSRLEGLNLAAKGVLQLFALGAADELKSVGQATGTIVAGAVQGAGAAAAPVVHSLWEIIPWWAWAAGGVLLVGAGIVVLKASPAGIALRALRGGI